MKGRELPEWYTNAPAALPGDDLIMDAFAHLNTERRYEGGPIPHSAVQDYGRNLLEMSDGLCAAFTAILTAMDQTYLAWLDKERKKRTPEKPKTPQVPPVRPGKRR